MKKTMNPTNSEILIPRFSLPPPTGGGELGPADYNQNSNLVIFFFHSWDCGHRRQQLRSLKEDQDRYSSLNTAILAVSEDPLEDLKTAAEVIGPDIPLLSDPGVEVTTTYAGDTGAAHLPFLVVADRFGAFYTRMEMEESADIDHGEIQSTLLFIETQCPECGHPRGDTLP